MILKTPVRTSTFTLIAIGMLDLVSTLALMHAGVREANPIFSRLALLGGAVAFAAGKLMFLVGPILVLEFVRQKSPKSAEQGTWLAVVFYSLLYVGHMAIYIR